MHAIVGHGGKDWNRHWDRNQNVVIHDWTQRPIDIVAAGHLAAEVAIASLEVFMAVRAQEGPSGNSNEAPTTQLTRETCELSGLEVARQDLFGQALLVTNGECFAARVPADYILMVSA